MEFTKELKEYMMPLGTLSENDIIDFEKQVKDMPFSLKEILEDKNIDTLIFDKGFVSYTYKNAIHSIEESMAARRSTNHTKTVKRQEHQQPNSKTSKRNVP